MGYKVFIFLGMTTFATWAKAGTDAIETSCLKHTISFSQDADQYQWTMEWDAQQPFERYGNYFSESAGEVLERNSEVVQNMWWKKRGSATGDLEAWLMVDSGISKSKKFFSRNCKLDSSSVFCQLNTGVGNGGERINWAWSKINCRRGSDQGKPFRCNYQEAGSVKSAAPFASAATISIAINTQGIKDAVRLAIASEYGLGAVKRGFATARSTADAVWNQGQSNLKAKRSKFKISVAQNCR